MSIRDKKKYLSLYEDVKNNIVAGIYKSGEKLPSKRVMAEREGVSVITVEHAYELLFEEGYIVPKNKSGYFVSYDSQELFHSASDITPTPKTVRPDYEVVSGESASEAPFSFSIYAKTIRRVLSEYSEDIMLRSPGYGHNILRKAIADYLGRYRSMTVNYERIIIGSGAEYLYGLIVQTLGRDRIYGIESPSYYKIAQVYEAGGVSIDMLPLGNDGIERSALWNTAARVLHITPYRSFPSGVTASAAKKREYLRWSVEKSAIIIEDDFESEFTPSRKPEETLFSIDTEGNVIYVNTFTCTIGPSIRIAYMVIPDRLEEQFAGKIGFYSCPVPTLDQYILAELIENGDFVRHINKVRRNNRNKNKS